jgi:hypothetical protein
MLSIVYRGVGIPVVWIVLSKAGASDTGERTTVMEIFLDLFGAQNVACLLGDREFVGREWFRFLKMRYSVLSIRLTTSRLNFVGSGISEPSASKAYPSSNSAYSPTTLSSLFC